RRAAPGRRAAAGPTCVRPSASLDRGSLDGEDLVQPAPMPRLAAELRMEEGQGALERGLHADDTLAQGEDVHVVVLDALVRRVGVVAHGRAHATDLGGGHARPHAGAADEDAALHVAVTDRLADPLREVRIVVVRIAAITAEIDELVIRAQRRHAPEQLVLQRRARVIRREADPHEWPGSVLPVRSTPGSPARADPS